MPDDELSRRIYRAARQLLPEMDITTRRVVEDLLKKAEDGAKTDNKIIEIISRDDTLREKFRSLLPVSYRSLSGFSSLGGYPHPTPGLTYVCPQCDYTRVLGEVGEDPGECPTHHVALIPQAQKGR